MQSKTILTAALAVLTAALFAADAKEAVRNGNFQESAPPPKNAKGITGTQWVKYWNCAGAATMKDGKIQLSSGVIYQFLNLPRDGKAYLLKGEVKAAAMQGKNAGQLYVRLSSCIRKDPKTPFSHSLQKKTDQFKLTPAVQTYKFEFKIEPYEQGYLYVGGGDMRLESVSIMTEPVAAK